MNYPDLQGLKQTLKQLELYSQLQTEYDAKGVTQAVARAEKSLRQALAEIKKLPAAPALAAREPDALQKILQLRPKGPRRLWHGSLPPNYEERLAGALLGRMAGCTLGAPVEFWPVDKMEALAAENGQPFPPTDYWLQVPEPAKKRYQMSRRDEYIRDNISGVPVDDDIVYTLLGLLIAEEFGPDFTVEDTARAWVKYLPHACTAEDAALKNLKRGVPAARAGAINNPYCEWIGADIRSDPWGYMAPGWPERAAAMAYNDAFISHRRQGIYGAMFFAAAIAAAFTVDDPVAALRIGLTEIPRDCALHKAVNWALRRAPEIRSYQDARAAVDAKFAGMNGVHTINNACLTVWGITIGGRDFSRVIGETVAMGLDNDCTAATAGSIVGAVVGKKGIPAHWHRNFNNTIHSYLLGQDKFTVTDVLSRFKKQATLIHGKQTLSPNLSKLHQKAQK